MKGNRSIAIVLCAALFGSIGTCRTASAEPATFSILAVSETEEKALKDDVQVIELANSNELPQDVSATEASDELPKDEAPKATASDELPQDEAPSTPTAKKMYETDTQVLRTYNGITEGQTITGTITHYDVCMYCCGKLDGVTASGLAIRNGMEDPHIVSLNWLPLGSIISVNGVEYTVADRGGSNLNTVGRVDIFTPAGHNAALQLGKVEAEITVLKIGSTENG